MVYAVIRADWTYNRQRVQRVIPVSLGVMTPGQARKLSQEDLAEQVELGVQGIEDWTLEGFAQLKPNRDRKGKRIRSARRGSKANRGAR